MDYWTIQLGPRLSWFAIKDAHPARLMIYLHLSVQFSALLN